jgi:hypothetical protein
VTQELDRGAQSLQTRRTALKVVVLHPEGDEFDVLAGPMQHLMPGCALLAGSGDVVLAVPGHGEWLRALEWRDRIG